VEVKAWRLV